MFKNYQLTFALNIAFAEVSIIKRKNSTTSHFFVTGTLKNLNHIFYTSSKKKDQ